jgi:hypothetical protein
MAKVTTNGLGIELRGRAGSAVFSMTANGLSMRPYTIPADPRTPAQMASRARLSRVSQRWKTLTPAQHRAWRDYAATVTRFHSYGGPPYSPPPHTLFIALGSKFLQVNPDGDIPLLPPAYPFFGDTVRVSAAGEPGAVVFTATGPNADGILTELLLQPLLHAGRKPKATLYRAESFVAFAPGSLTAAIPVAPGAYAPAYRFVNSLTGQEANRVDLEVLSVT